MGRPFRLALGPDGSLYIADDGQRIQRVTPDGIISTVATDGGAGVATDAAGSVYYYDGQDHSTDRA